MINNGPPLRTIQDTVTPLAGITGLGGFEVLLSKGNTLRSDASALNVGVFHLVPTMEVFPLVANPKL